MHISLSLPKQIAQSPTAVIYADQAVVSGLSFLSSVVLARYLGLEGFGIYSIAWLGVLIASSINQPFIISPMQTLSSRKEPDEQKAYLQILVFKQLFFAALMGFMAFLAVIIMSFLLDKWKVQSIILAFPLAVFSFLLQDFFRRYFFIIHKPYSALLIDIIAYGGVLLSAFAIHFVRSMDAQFVLLLTALFFLYASLIGLWSMEALRFNMTQFKTAVNEHWGFSKWLTATALLQWFSGNLFIIAAGAILGPKAVGATRMAQNIVGITHVLFLAMENIIPARAAKALGKGGIRGMMSYLRRFTLQTGALVLLLLAFIAGFSGKLIGLFYGPEFTGYSWMLVSFCGLYIIIFIGYPLRYAIRTLQMTRLIFISFIASSLFSIFTAYPIIRMFGLKGVLIGLFMTQMITLLIYWFSLKKSILKEDEESEPSAI
jgi:O-antigen/teichoic acid export membrane protein